MRKADLVRESIRLVAEYYKGNLQPFFDALSEDVLWIGPRAGQVLEGRDNLIAAWRGQDHSLSFSMGSVEGKAVPMGPAGLEVILGYRVYTYFPDGQVDEHHQRLHYSWGLRKEGGSRVPKAFMIHISNIMGGNAGDGASALSPGADGKVKVYASSPSDSRIDAVRFAEGLSRIRFRSIYSRGENQTTLYFNAAEIAWVESADEGRHSVVHALDGDYRSMERLAYFEENAGGMLLRAHASHLVNPMHVRSIARFSVTMSDGAVLPVPEKKYTAFKRKLDGWRMPL